MTERIGPAVLLILDGWGHREQIAANAIAAARKPVWDRLWHNNPHGLIQTSGAAVGLPSGQMGNSEVGHLNLGAGRVVYQEFTRVSRAIRTGSFFTNLTLTNAVDLAIDNAGSVHILGLLSSGGVHGHQDHIHAMIRLAAQRQAKKIYLHAFLDGRDTPPKSAQVSLQATSDLFQDIGVGRIASVIGRYYAMDRDNNWPRIQSAYELFVKGRAEHRAKDPLQALAMAYDRGEIDEFVTATAVIPDGDSAVTMEDGDSIVFMNYRSDRARQLTRALIEDEFAGFARIARPKFGAFVSLTEYSNDFDVPVAFPPERLDNSLGEYIAHLGLRQLRVAESEKYAHVTYFFNGGREQAFEGEDRILVPSPSVATYDLQPAMSAHEVTDRLVEAIGSGKYDAIVCNYANPDMVGHTGKMQAAVQAIEQLDKCLARVYAALQQAHGEMLITADHGNAEQMLDPASNQAHTAHTHNLVPLIYVGRKAEMEKRGALRDIAPTLLKIMGLKQPPEMTGHPLLHFPLNVDAVAAE